MASDTSTLVPTELVVDDVVPATVVVAASVVVVVGVAGATVVVGSTASLDEHADATTASAASTSAKRGIERIMVASVRPTERISILLGSLEQIDDRLYDTVGDRGRSAENTHGRRVQMNEFVRNDGRQ